MYPNVARWIGVVLLVSTHATSAWAHPKVDEGRMYFEEADFEKALAALGEAEEADNLTRAELAELLRLRVLVNLGLGEMEAVGADLERLLSLEPEHVLGEEVPPEVRQQAERIRAELTGPIQVDAKAVQDAGIQISAEASYDPASLIRRIVVAGRLEGGEWKRAEGKSPTLSLGDADRAEYYAEALGPGGAVIAKDGSWNEPNVFTPGLPGGQAGETTEEGDKGGPGAALFASLGVGAAVVVGVVIGVVMLGGGTSDATRPSVPMVIR